MRPKTAIQKRVHTLSGLIRPPSKEHVKYAKNRLFDDMYYTTKKDEVCLECGYRWQTNKIEHRCPKCRVYFARQLEKDRTKKEQGYLNIITTVKEFQVVRTIFFKKERKVDKPAYYDYCEVVQHWIRGDGKHVVRYADKYGMGAYRMFYDPWRLHTDLQIRQSLDADCCYLWGTEYEKTRFLPEVIRNGYFKETFKLHIAYFLAIILGNSYAETLLKSGQYSLLSKFNSKEKQIYEYWDSIKICIRNNYEIKDPTTWFDHLNLLQYFNKDLHNPKYICPRKLKEEHQILTDRHNYIEDKKREEVNKEKLIQLNKEYIKSKKKFLNVQFNQGKINIRVLKNIYEFIDEGKELHHCVYSPAYYQNKDSLILSARKEDKRLATIELSLKQMKVVQCRGLQNKSTGYNRKIINLINSNINVIKRINESANKVNRRVKTAC